MPEADASASSVPTVLKLEFPDFELLAESIQGWDLDWRQLDGGHLRASLEQVESESALLTRVAFNRSFLQRGGCPPGVRTFGILGAGVQQVRWCGLRPTDSHALVFPSSDYHSVSRPGFNGLTLSFPEEHLAEVAQTLGHPEGLEVASPGSLVTGDPRQVAALRGRLENLLDPAFVSPGSAAARAVRYELEFAIPAMLIRSISSGQPLARPSAKTRSRALRRAMDLIDAEGSEYLNVSDLCDVAGASWRTLNYAFREHFEMTPKQYLQTLNLTGAYRDLLTAKQDARVSDIANRWGFWHLGQFAADYRHHFGELPSETLASH